MSRGRWGWCLPLLLLGAAWVAPAAAADGPRAEARDQMRRLLSARLKSDVGLDDRQIEGVLPQIEAIESQRREAARKRLGHLAELRQGLAAGASDDDLQQTLDALDRSEQAVERETRSALAGIDASLTVPQRVRLRFLLVRFRGEMLRRVEGARQGGGRARTR